MIPFWRSLVFKLLLAFALAGLLGFGLQFLLMENVTLLRFRNYLDNSRVRDIAMRSLNYYRENGSWSGVEKIIPPPPPPLNGDPNRPLPNNAGEAARSGPGLLIGLLDAENRVIIPIEGTRPGEIVDLKDFPLRQELILDGKRIGTALRLTTRERLTPEEHAFVLTLQRSLLWSGGIALLLASGLGIVMAVSLVRPLRRLTEASQRFTLRDSLSPLREGRDEVGQLAKAFNQMSSDLSDADRQRRQMLADIAHDLGTPLTVVSGYVQSMRDGKLQATPERLETIYDELRLLQNLIDDLRLLSLADAGKLTLNREEIAPSVLLSTVQKAFQHRAEKAGITLSVDASKSLPNIVVDSERIRQVLGNLVNNALRHTPQGGQIRLVGWTQANAVLLEVQDTGVGIAPEKLPHIFERFYRADESRNTENGEGSGLGLAIAKAIVELHGGEIIAESVPGEGTSMKIRLPLEKQ